MEQPNNQMACHGAPNYLALKHKLQSFGAIRPEAWESIVSGIIVLQLGPGDSYYRKRGSLTFVAEGALKEYNPYNRKNPAIMSFLTAGDFFVSQPYNLHQFLIACTPCCLLTLEYNYLIQLQADYPELLKIFDCICACYNEHTEFRMLLLEKPITERISLFKERYHSHYVYFKKTDIANYLHVSYNHLISNWNTPIT